MAASVVRAVNAVPCKSILKEDSAIVKEVIASVATSRVMMASAVAVKVTFVTIRQSGLIPTPLLSVQFSVDQFASPESVAFTVVSVESAS